MGFAEYSKINIVIQHNRMYLRKCKTDAARPGQKTGAMMTISSKLTTQQPIATILNLSTSKRSFMILDNPDGVDKSDWFIHIHIFGFSFVYFSLNTPEADSAFPFLGVL